MKTLITHFQSIMRYQTIHRGLLITGMICLIMGCSKSDAPQQVATPQVQVNVLPSTLEEKAQIAMARGNWKDAEKFIKELLKKNPNDHDILYNLAFIADEQHQYSKAKQLYQKLITKNPKNVYAHGGLGWVEFKLNNYHKSLEHSQKAVTLKPELVPAWLNIGLAYIALERLENAMEAYEKAAFLDKQGHYKNDAINDLNEYLRENPNASPLGYYTLAYYYKMSGLRTFEKKSIQVFLDRVKNHPFRQNAEEHLKEIEQSEKEMKQKAQKDEARG